MSDNENVEATDAKLLGLVTRIERMEEDKKGIADDITAVYAEVNAQGYNSKLVREIVRLRKIDADKRTTEEMELEVYKCAVGMV